MKESNQVVQYMKINDERYPQPIRKVSTSLCQKQSDSSLTDFSDQKKRKSKSAQYWDTCYITLLVVKRSYMKKSDLSVINTSLTWCKTLLNSEQTVLKDSLFWDDIFKTTCCKVQNRNEPQVIHSISLYIASSVKNLKTLSATQLRCLIKNINEGWTGSISVKGPQPQLNYFVEFRQSVFTVKQLNRLDLLISTIYDTFFFITTYWMYFLFLTCKVKCSAAALDVADWQNTHSMTIAVKGVVKLYKAVKHEKKLYWKIIDFSISYDHSSVRIYGHYTVINRDKTTFYCHSIHKFDFTALDDKDKWTAYKFIKNVYDV